ncbi:MAG: signal recognition particle-docking protein FtsY [Clostridia bacterium]|nr:signal recognition particle-docking protein FtsY [Clostridia bacterium]
MGIFGNFFKKIKYVFTKNELNDDFYDELEQTLISSDMGVTTSEEIIEEFKDTVKKRMIKDVENAQKVLREILIEKLHFEEVKFEYPMIITVVGVNGVGKTTSIAKMANYFGKQKKNVMLVAGDTFRAAATEQLDEWANRLKIKIVKQGEGADSASVVFDGITSMKAKKADVLIVDTAGRLHTKVNLMKELEKINNVAKREYPEAKHINLIVLDASIGQNSLAQVQAFKKSVNIDGIILTKLDGTAKGGVAYPIVNELQVPIVFTGFGETINDLSKFNVQEFVDKILMYLSISNIYMDKCYKFNYEEPLSIEWFFLLSYKLGY